MDKAHAGVEAVPDTEASGCQKRVPCHCPAAWYSTAGGKVVLTVSSVDHRRSRAADRRTCRLSTEPNPEHGTHPKKRTSNGGVIPVR
jgi:hypothetical protein